METITTSDGRVLQVNEAREVGRIFDFSAERNTNSERENEETGDLVSKFNRINITKFTSVLERVLAEGFMPASAPEILQRRIECDNPNDSIYDWITAMSEVDIIGDDVYLTHGGLILRDPNRIRQQLSVQKSGVPMFNSSVKLTDDECTKISEGNTGTRIITYDQFLKETAHSDITEPCTIKVDRRLFYGLPNGENGINTYQWARDIRAIMYAGSIKRAKAYAERVAEIHRNRTDKIEQAYVSLGIDNYGIGNCGEEEPSNRARLLTVWGKAGGGINFGVTDSEQMYFDYPARFLGIPQKQSKETKESTGEE